MVIEGKEYSKEELLRYSGNLSTLFCARRIVFSDGKMNGVKAVDVKTAGGLRLLISEERCLDILELSFKGINMGYLSRNGVVSNMYAHPYSIPYVTNFRQLWSGGMLATCGLKNIGKASESEGEQYNIHGRIGLTPAENVSIQVDENNIVISGIMRETQLFGANLELHRIITIASDGSKIHLCDEVINNSPATEQVMLMYHINFGFPFLSKNTELRLPSGDVVPRTLWAEKNIEDRHIITDPVDVCEETVYYHYPRDEKVMAELINHDLGVKASVFFNRDELPLLVEWKTMQSGEYALGLEPSTSRLEGREEEIKRNDTVELPPFSSKQFNVNLNFYCI
jgi:hypothetical protein